MTVNAEVRKVGNENNANVIRRFTKRIQSAGILKRVKGIRYSERSQSSYKQKKAALKKLKRKEEVEELIKMGKMSDTRRV
jgi:ribosomal protein S21